MASAYEKLRQEKIAQNMAELKSLKLEEMSENIGLKGPKPTKKRKTPSKSKKEKPPSTPSRISARLQGVGADGTKVDRKVVTRYLDEIPAAENMRRERKSGPVEIVPSWDEATAAESKQFVRGLRDLPARLKSHAADGSSWNMTTFRNFSSWDHDVKILSKRIYTMMYHPDSTADRSIVCVGDTNGSVAFYQTGINIVRDHVDNKDEPANVFRYDPHVNVVTNVKFGTHDKRLYSTSHDGSVRCMDLNKEVWSEIYVDKNEISLSSLDFACNGNNFFVSDSKGKVRMIDTRARTSSGASYYELHDRKIGSVHCHPLNEHYLATGSNDRTACLWDVRKMKDTSSYLHQFEHDQSCSSAHFSPSGRLLLTTSYDNYLRVFAITDSKQNMLAEVGAPAKISHNNETGRWVTTFRSVWCPAGDAFIVGNMSRGLDFYQFDSLTESKTGGLALKAPSHLLRGKNTIAIPAVNACHPAIPEITSGTASGKIYKWYLPSTAPSSSRSNNNNSSSSSNNNNNSSSSSSSNGIKQEKKASHAMDESSDELGSDMKDDTKLTVPVSVKMEQEDESGSTQHAKPKSKGKGKAKSKTTADSDSATDSKDEKMVKREQNADTENADEEPQVKQENGNDEAEDEDSASSKKLKRSRSGQPPKKKRRTTN